MLYPTSKPSSANVVRYRSKTPRKKEVLTQTLRACLRLHSLIVESKVVTPTFSWDYFRVDNKIRVSCVQWSGEQKSEGNPGHWDSNRFDQPLTSSNSREASGVILLPLGPDRIPDRIGAAGQAEERSIEAKKAAGPGLEEQQTWESR